MSENNKKRILSKIEQRYSRMKLSQEINEDRASVRTKLYYLY